MITSTLARIENYQGFLGTFDNVKWWRSQTIPNLDTILSVAWIYGEFHVCAAKMKNGSYSIWQSRDHGYSWQERVNTSEKIYDVIQPDYGAALAATSKGWWKSENSGTDWKKISTQAPGCHTVKEICHDRLIAIDGTYVWWSANCGKTWTKAVIQGTATTLTAKADYPALAGTWHDIFIGCTTTNAGGSGTDRLIYSDDGGVSYCIWHNVYGHANGWDNRETGRTLKTDIVTDIELVQTQYDVPRYMIQVLMPSGYCRHYRAWRTRGGEYHTLDCAPKFDAYSSPGKSLFAYDNNVTGSDVINYLCVFSGMESASSGGKPLVKRSTDGGETWKDTSLSTVTVYDSPDYTNTTTNPFVEDSFVSYAWSHDICHNGWYITEAYWEKRQSYDMGFLMSTGRLGSATYRSDADIEAIRTATYRASQRIIPYTMGSIRGRYAPVLTTQTRTS